jgi:hypothetical protein
LKSEYDGTRDLPIQQLFFIFPANPAVLMPYHLYFTWALASRVAKLYDIWFFVLVVGEGARSGKAGAQIE